MVKVISFDLKSGKKHSIKFAYILTIVCRLSSSCRCSPLVWRRFCWLEIIVIILFVCLFVCILVLYKILIFNGFTNIFRWFAIFPGKIVRHSWKMEICLNGLHYDVACLCIESKQTLKLAKDSYKYTFKRLRPDMEHRSFRNMPFAKSNGGLNWICHVFYTLEQSNTRTVAPVTTQWLDTVINVCIIAKSDSAKLRGLSMAMFSILISTHDVHRSHVLQVLTLIFVRAYRFFLELCSSQPLFIFSRSLKNSHHIRSHFAFLKLTFSRTRKHQQ